MNAGLTLESSAKMRAQDLHSAFPYHRPINCLLELFAHYMGSAYLILELPPTVRSLISF